MPNRLAATIEPMSSATPSALERRRAANPLGEWPAPTLPGLSVVMPCFDDEDTIADAIRGAVSAATRLADAFEIIVIDDGSSDATASAAARAARANPSVRLIVHASHRGSGVALRSGMRAAGQPWVLLTDAQLRLDTGHLEDFLPAARSSDLVVGWRIMREDTTGRRMRSAIWNRLVRRLFRLPVRDVDCAFKLVRRDLLGRIELTSREAMIGTELIVRSLATGARLSEVAIRDVPPSAGAGRPSRRRTSGALRELGGLYRTLRYLSREVPAT
jgi:glycosyltransferase involved in cell wall biosynthesis